jgi:hypothetical protein
MVEGRLRTACPSWPRLLSALAAILMGCGGRIAQGPFGPATDGGPSSSDDATGAGAADDGSIGVDSGRPDSSLDATLTEDATDDADAAEDHDQRPCTPLETGVLIPVNLSTAAPPQLRGGALQGGRYIASSATLYGPACFGYDTASFEWLFVPDATGSSGTFATAVARPSPLALMTSTSGTYVSDGSTLIITRTCAVCCSGETIAIAATCNEPSRCQTIPPDGGTNAYEYEVQGSQLILETPVSTGGCGVLVIVLDRVTH